MYVRGQIKPTVLYKKQTSLVVCTVCFKIRFNLLACFNLYATRKFTFYRKFYKSGMLTYRTVHGALVISTERGRHSETSATWKLSYTIFFTARWILEIVTGDEKFSSVSATWKLSYTVFFTAKWKLEIVTGDVKFSSIIFVLRLYSIYAHMFLWRLY